jgi:hypothetical protein
VEDALSLLESDTARQVCQRLDLIEARSSGISGLAMRADITSMSFPQYLRAHEPQSFHESHKRYTRQKQFGIGQKLAMVEKSSHAQKCNTEDVINGALERVNQESNHGIGSKGTKDMRIGMDNCQVCQALDSADKLHTMKLPRPPHPP